MCSILFFKEFMVCAEKIRVVLFSKTVYYNFSTTKTVRSSKGAYQLNIIKIASKILQNVSKSTHTHDLCVNFTFYWNSWYWYDISIFVSKNKVLLFINYVIDKTCVLHERVLVFFNGLESPFSVIFFCLIVAMASL
jgi:hypothetical protein